jgi:ABC-type transporter Mla maintaining outer membrane lipid asymmetry ATPase subunit MlaF
VDKENVIQLLHADIPRAQVTSPIAVVRDVDWSVGRGDFWIVGAQPGAGKTDLLCTAAGLQKPMKGEQLLFDKDTEKMSEEELVVTRLRIAMVFTSGRLFNGLTIAQNIALPLSYHHSLDESELADRVNESLKTTGLTEWQNKRPDQITRNLHQRVGLARALALQPEVVLIDNPIGGVDPRQGRWWLDFLCELKQKMTVVVAADDFRPWMDVGEQFAILRERHMELIGGREEIRQSKDTLVRELLTSAFERA